jgi:hypothetical protein
MGSGCIRFNDMPEGITSNVRLFADDTIAYLTISSDQDARTFQSDLDKLEKWETSWLMAFHPEKCNALTITKKRNQINFKRPSRNCNTLAFSIPSCRTSIRKESLYPRTTKDWNALKDASVGAPSLEAFKACLRQ